MNPIGSFVSPALIFSRKKWKQEVIDDAPAGTLGLCPESGWMTGDLFCNLHIHLKIIKPYLPYLKPYLSLLLDGHVSHKQLEVISLAKENGVLMICFPPHCTHRLQPLDVSYFGPLSTYYNQGITKWLKNNPGRTVTPFQLGKLFSEAYERSATM
ncbi:hypothetical protein PPYR_02335 [Photinus pyralis]|uniref:DDE-1 domain-containing protein n=1 Tax=Photinus pyralis TaxID=7054 RepID=A0A5N4B6Z0_PHOPY|nr:hypothetical protein PPYR_02335 [Photinus pyralis]